MSKHDYIIIGAGAAGLLLADALGKDQFFASKSILVLDKDDKSKNDRTWCFWEKGEGDFETLIHKSWDTIFVAGQKLHKSTAIAPYTYKMLRGIDFYNHYVPRVKAYPNINWVKEEVIKVEERTEGVLVTTKNGKYQAKIAFSSLYDGKGIANQKRFPVLQQHFLGWFVKTEHPSFNPDVATFMDFSIPQKGNTRFMYVLPFSKTEALVEYTLFSKNLLEKSEYEAAIKNYLKEQYNNPQYTIQETEFGSIPMTCYPFHQHNSENLFHIGVAGGWAKPSTGFTFHHTNQQIRHLVLHLKQEKPLPQFYKKNRFRFYDMLLLDILFKDNHLGQSIFESLFLKRKASLILRFLGNESNLWDELKIVSAPPAKPFLKALWGRLF